MEVKRMVSDRVIAVAKGVIRRRAWMALSLVAVLVPLAVYAGSTFHVFQPNTPISSVEMNENFVMLQDSDAELGDRIGTYEDAITVDPTTGNVGVGTGSPYQKFHLAGNNARLAISNDAGNNWAEIGNDGSSGLNTLEFFTKSSSVSAMTIGPGGNVGIGTTSPGGKLTIGGANNVALTFQPSSLGGWRAAEIQGIDPGSDFRGQLAFSTHANDGSGVTPPIERMRIDDRGNVGIGTTEPDAPLSVRSAGTVADMTIGSSNGGSVARISGIKRNSSPLYGDLAFGTYNSGWKEVVRMTAEGNVGIGTTTPAYKLDVTGQIRVDGVVYPSDRRLKKDITPLKDALEGIECLQGVSYVLRDPKASQEVQLGLIAQDVEKCFPEVVSTDPTGMKAVSYDRLVAPLIEAVKKQQSTISQQARETGELRSALAATNAALDAQSARLARLEALLAARR